MLAREALGELGVAPLERLDDLQVLDDRARGAIVLRDRGPADGAHVQEEIPGRLLDQPRASEADDHLMEGDVGVGILVDVLGGRRVLERVEQVAELADLRIGRVQRREARRHALERRPHLDHLDDFALGLADDEDASARDRPDEALLLENGQRLAHRRATHPERLDQLPLIQPQRLSLAVDVGVRDRVLQQRVSLIAETARVERCQSELSCHRRAAAPERRDYAHRAPRCSPPIFHVRSSPRPEPGVPAWRAPARAGRAPCGAQAPAPTQPLWIYHIPRETLPHQIGAPPCGFTLHTIVYGPGSHPYCASRGGCTAC